MLAKKINMHSNAQLAFKFIKYYLTASNGKGHGIHSPFVYDFVRNVLNKKNVPENFALIENRRKSLASNSTWIEVLDRGAGSRISDFKKRTISSIARSALKQKKISQLLYRMGVYFNPSQVVEMGTSLGITSSYLAMSQPNQTLVTMEGAPAIAKEAQITFDLLGLQNIKLVEGDFATSLPAYLDSVSQVGMVYVDGNHRYQPTMQYFENLLDKVNDQSILIFDDIYWSSEMEKAWSEIKNHAAVTLTIDLFYLGIVFFRKENKQQQHFKIRF
jgi:predicted O-methyltransferase YrrM